MEKYVENFTSDIKYQKAKLQENPPLRLLYKKNVHIIKIQIIK